MPATASHRLTYLGVPAVFHKGLVARRAPRFHNLVHLTIIFASIAAAVAAIAAWSYHVETAADDAAKAAHALLYDSDIGAGSLGLILTILFAAGWLCASITWRRGSEIARSGWAVDLMHEPAKNKAITDWLWRQMIRRHANGAVNADDFLDRLSGGVVRDLRVATLVMFALTAVLGALMPARVSYATDTIITDHPVLPLTRDVVRPVGAAATVISGCPNLPKEAIPSFTDSILRTDQRRISAPGDRWREAVSRLSKPSRPDCQRGLPVSGLPIPLAAIHWRRSASGRSVARRARTVLDACCSYWPCRKRSERG